MPSFNFLVVYEIFCIAVLIITSPIIRSTAYIIKSPNALMPQTYTAQHPITSLASKVIYESPSMGNIYKEYIVTSKPLTLRKYTNGIKKKIKKTKKDSKIYFISMPPIPYRFIPGVGYDYQPMKIKPIMQEAPTITTNNQHKLPNVMISPENNSYEQMHHKNEKNSSTTTSSAPSSNNYNAATNTTPLQQDSKIIHLNFISKYFNGRPLSIKVAHAATKNHLTPVNLKSKFYIDKPIIY